MHGTVAKLRENKGFMLAFPGIKLRERDARTSEQYCLWHTSINHLDI